MGEESDGDAPARRTRGRNMAGLLRAERRNILAAIGLKNGNKKNWDK